MKIEKSICENFVRVTLSDGTSETMTIGEWSKVLASFGQFQMDKVPDCNPLNEGQKDG